MIWNVGIYLCWKYPVVPLDECTEYPSVQQSMQLLPSQLKSNILELQEGDGDNQKYGEVDEITAFRL